jgi:hypothetical protein
VTYLETGGSVGGAGKHQEHHHEFHRFFRDPRNEGPGRNEPFVRFNDYTDRGLDPGKNPFGSPFLPSLDGENHRGDHEALDRTTSFQTSENRGGDEKIGSSSDHLRGTHGHSFIAGTTDSLAGVAKTDYRTGFPGTPTISATHGSSWFTDNDPHRSFFVGTDGFHTVGAATSEHATTYFGYGVPVSASGGNTSLHGVRSDSEHQVRDVSVGPASLHGALAPSAIGSVWSPWDGKQSFGPSASGAAHDETKGSHLGASWTLNDGTKITLADYKSSYFNKNS